MNQSVDTKIKTPKLSVWYAITTSDTMYEIYTFMSDENINVLKKLMEWEFNAEKNQLLFLIKPENAKYHKVWRNVACCAFNGTDEYMKHMLGMSLDHDDKNWYTNCSLVIESGLPEENIFPVIQELVAPYGLGISHAYVRKGSRLSTNNKPWFSILGINPMASISGDVSNEEYLSILSGGDKEVADILRTQVEDFHLEFVDEVPHGAYIMFRKYTTNASRAGHSIYSGPRANKQDFAVALKLDWLKNIKYHAVVPDFNYNEVGPQNKVDFWECLADDGKKLKDHRIKYQPHNYKGSISGDEAVCNIRKDNLFAMMETGIGLTPEERAQITTIKADTSIKVMNDLNDKMSKMGFIWDVGKYSYVRDSKNIKDGVYTPPQLVNGEKPINDAIGARYGNIKEMDTYWLEKGYVWDDITMSYVNMNENISVHTH